MFIICCLDLCYHCFFFNDTATTEIYTLSLHDALPISISTSRLWPTACVGPLESTRLPSGPLWDIVSSCPERWSCRSSVRWGPSGERMGTGKGRPREVTESEVRSEERRVGKGCRSRWSP